jgi:LemA protein
MKSKGVGSIIGIFLLGVLAVTCIGATFVANTNNSAIRYDQLVQEQKSVIDVQTQRRHDLILSLVSTVDASGQFEKSTLTDVIQMRQNAQSGKVDEAMLNVNALTEAYPELKTTEAYKQLMTELSITENLISEQRKTYNNAVRDYQQYIQSLPTNIFLNISGYKKQDYQYLQFNTPEYSTNLFNNAK